jgi:hypothetical protein
MIIGVVVLGILTAVLLLVLLGDDDRPPTAGTSPGTNATGSLSGSTGAAVSPSVAASPGVGASASAPAGLTADSVTSVTVEALALRAEPGLEGEVEWRLPADTLGFIVAGPAEADGLPWYQISGMGLPYASGCVTPEAGELLDCPAFLGWVAGSGADGETYLAPAPSPECPAAPHTVVSLSEQPYTYRLICFDAEPLTFRAWWPELPDDAGQGGACAASDTEVGWLVCQNINDVALAANPDEEVGRLSLSLDPAAGLAMPDRGQWIEVTGHFDHPAARDCGGVADVMEMNAGELVFNCRLQFVPSAIAPAEAP